MASLAEEPIKRGYDLYENVKLIDKPGSPNDLVTVTYTTGYLAGFLDGVVLTQDALYYGVFPRKYFSEAERVKIAKEMNFQRLKIPEGELQTGQPILIFKKYAERHPENLNNSARACVLEALIEAYGWN